MILVYFKQKHRDAIRSIVSDLWKSSEASIWFVSGVDSSVYCPSRLGQDISFTDILLAVFHYNLMLVGPC